MIFKEFGNKNLPTIILLHGGGLSWWSWRLQIEALQEEYHIATPIIDGHGDDFQNTFESIEKCAGEVVQYIKENSGGRVYAICGLSIGAQILVEILSRESEITEYAVIESALVYPIKSAVAMTVPMYRLCYGLIKKRWYAKLQAKPLNLPEEMFEDYYRDSSRMTIESLINMTISNGNYTMPMTLRNTKAKVLVMVGEKELSVMKKSAALLNKTIEISNLMVIEKCGHGEISLKQSYRYLDLLKQFFQINNK